MDSGITITTQYSESEIRQSMDLPDSLKGKVDQVIQLKEQGVREALQALGWKSPEEAERLKGERDAMAEKLRGTVKRLLWELAEAKDERDALAAHVERLNKILFDTFAALDDGDINAIPYDAYRSAYSDTPATSLARRDEEQARKGFWWGFERARCHPDQHNIRVEWEEVKRLRRQAEPPE